MNAMKVWNDRDVDQILARLVLGCMLVAGCVVLVGGIVYLVRHGSEIPNYHAFRSEPSDLRSVTGVVSHFFSFRGTGIIQFGLLLLILTPLTWVIFLFIAFIKQRDWLYSIVSIIVAAILVYSLAGGHIG